MDNMTVRLDSFSGPLDLLYHLIEKNEIDIYDINISSLTDQYIEFISREENKNMDGMSEFIVMAATLIEIKSRMLLPKPQTEEPEEDPREELVQKLLEYKKFKGVTGELMKRSEEASNVFFREPDSIIPELVRKEAVSVEDSLKGLTMDDLYRAFCDVLVRKEKKVDRVRSSFKSVKHDNFTIDEKIVSLRDMLHKKPRVRFYEMFSDDVTKEEVLVTFLALLELIRRHSALVEQDSNFGEIMISAGENLDKDTDEKIDSGLDDSVREDDTDSGFESGDNYENE